MSKIYLLADIHHGSDVVNKAGKVGINTHGNTQALLKLFLQKVTNESGVVINLGDLVFGSTKEEKINLFTNILSNFSDINTYHLLGNYELFGTSKKDIEELTKQQSRISFELGGYKHILLDIEQADSLMRISGETITWLKSELAYDGNVIVYCHYPITEEEGNISYIHKLNPQKSFLINSGEIRKIIENSACKLFISAHTHFYYESVINGVKHVTVPSFSEDNNGIPNGTYGIVDLETGEIHIDSVKL